MDAQRIRDFLSKHRTHTISVERQDSSGVRVGRLSPINLCPKWVKDNWDSPTYVLGIPISHVTAVYCCGEVCK